MSKSDASRDGRPAARAHLDRLRTCLGAVSPTQIAAVAERLWQVARAGGLILIAGNGGSAATASHMAVDLGKSSLGRPARTNGMRVRALCLGDSAPVVTAWANDEGYARVFAEQIAALAGPEDAVVLLSVSGDSPNVVAAARAARAAGATVVALLGGRGGAVRALADLAVIVPSDDYFIVEDVHLAINHIVTGYFRGALATNETPKGETTRGRRGHQRLRRRRRNS